MKRVSLFLLAGIVLLLFVISFSCTKPALGSTNTSGSDSILLNIGNNIILPAYDSLGITVNSLDSAITDFNSSPNSTKLSNVQTLFEDAYTAWQSASEYDYFGPASNAQPTLSGINIFPADTIKITANITNGSYNINAFANTAAKGFPALDYLLFGRDNTTLLTDYTTDAKAVNRKQYLTAVSADIKSEANAVLNQWLANDGNYITTFVNGTGNSVSSSLGLLLNSIDQDFEILKNDRLGIPLGKIPVGSSNPLAPSEVEAYYSGISVRLAVAQLKAVQGIYLGTGERGNGLGLNNYLTSAEQQNNLRYNGGLLSDTIKADFVLALSELQAVPDPLSANLANANATAAFAETQQLVTLLKTDMPSDLGVLISYGDNDGD
jgi:predicted lipoprotein